MKGTPAEVYSRIVGYYRSVRNWNRGKREEYGERLLYRVSEETARPVPVRAAGAKTSGTETAGQGQGAECEKGRLLLFVRPACPACPSAKDAAGRLGIPVDLVNADTEEGLAEAGRRNVFSTPTAILLAGDGSELGRARDSGSIAAWGKRLAV